jgi:protein-L-isoaspartate O-methyltransferase
MDLRYIYARHPLSARTILARLTRQGVNADTLTEWDLAVDEDTGITDQNHSGGVASVLELATAARITPGSVVLDVGTGLGGSARVLAVAFGCRVTGIDSDVQRIEDARALTERTRLTALTTFRHEDALREGPKEAFDVLWGQEAWIHFPRPEPFLDSWLPALATGGRVIIADSYLARSAVSDDERTLLTNLQHFWGAHIHPLSVWQAALERRGCAVTSVRDRSAQATSSLSKMLTVSERWPPEDLSDFERDGWQCASACFALGLVCSSVLVAIKRGG